MFGLAKLIEIVCNDKRSQIAPGVFNWTIFNPKNVDRTKTTPPKEQSFKHQSFTLIPVPRNP